ncbi:MAG: hypothetical protein KGK09_06290 [Burkholderiales bacterium]|nr:hypothetical protein [Burkholderiales bacterium]
MLIIRQAQLDVLGEQRMREFEDRALAHLQRWMPRHSRLLGPAPMLRLVRRGLARARHHGLHAECTVLGYLDLMCLLGSGFDADPLLPWAAEILNEPRRADPVPRGDRLYDAAWQYIDRIVPDYRDAGGVPVTDRLVRLLRQVRALPREPLAEAELADFADTLAALLAGYFPAKLAVVGRPAARAALQAACRRARGHGLHGRRGAALVALLAFVLGDGFDDDPLLPWVPAILQADADEATRVDRLFATGADTLRRWWDLEAAPAAP